jgi:hypothetical protein
MNKTEFLKQAMTKFKAYAEGVTNGVDYKSEMNFIYSEELILRVYISLEDGKALFCHRWCTVETLEDKQELVDQVLDEMRKDFECGDITAIDELLQHIDDKWLKGYLPEKL